MNNQVDLSQPYGNLRIYGCGGFGINITSHFEPAAGTQEPGHSKPFPVYIDTSHSNLHANLKPEHVFTLEGVDGSGAVRSENHEQIDANVRNILEIHKPMDFNVVIFSASGGSGSVFGPLIMAELLERGCSVVGIVVGSSECTKRTENTLRTLKSLEAIAKSTQQTVVIAYEHNTREVKRSEVDAQCKHLVGNLSVLCSRRNNGMDSMDLANWIQFQKVTTVKPRLVSFGVYRGNEAAENAPAAVSVASLYASPDEEPINITPDYHCTGYPRDEVKGYDTVHFMITLEDIPKIAKMVQDKLSELYRQRTARVEHKPLLEDTDKVTSSRLVL